MRTKLFGFAVLPCGCVINRYREGADGAEVAYVEEKGLDCLWRRHRANKPVIAEFVPKKRDPVAVDAHRLAGPRQGVGPLAD